MHEITHEIRKHIQLDHPTLGISLLTEECDVIFRAWLSKKSEELVEHGISSDRHGRLKARHILGLEPKQDEPCDFHKTYGEPVDYCKMRGCFKKEPAVDNNRDAELLPGGTGFVTLAVDTSSEKWCEHLSEDSKVGIHLKQSYGEWKYCPQCGSPAPRPEKTLAEVLREKCPVLGAIYSLDEFASKRLADVAVQFFLNLIKSQPVSNDPEDYSHVFKDALIQKVRGMK